MKTEITSISSANTKLPDPKAGSFYDKVVEYSPMGIAAIAAYMCNISTIFIGIGVGCALVYKNLLTRSTTVANPVTLAEVDPFTLMLEKLESSNIQERFEGIEEVAENYDNVSPEQQLEMIKAMFKMLSNNVSFDTDQVVLQLLNKHLLGEIQMLIRNCKLKDEHKFQAFINGCADYIKNVREIGEIEWTKYVQKNGNIEVLNKMINVILVQEFIPIYGRFFRSRQDSLAPLVKTIRDFQNYFSAFNDSDRQYIVDFEESMKKVLRGLRAESELESIQLPNEEDNDIDQFVLQ